MVSEFFIEFNCEDHIVENKGLVEGLFQHGGHGNTPACRRGREDHGERII